MNATATEVPKEVQFTMPMGNYTAQSVAKRGFFRIEKLVATPQGMKPVTRFVPMESVLVHLTHKSGDTVTIRKTTMGKAGRTTYTRLDNLPLEMVQNKLATGDAWIPKNKAPKSLTEEQAHAEIVRMTKCNPDDAFTLLSFDALLAAQ